VGIVTSYGAEYRKLLDKPLANAISISSPTCIERLWDQPRHSCPQGVKRQGTEADTSSLSMADVKSKYTSTCTHVHSYTASTAATIPYYIKEDATSELYQTSVEQVWKSSSIGGHFQVSIH
jgi:hypothetical protein